MRRSHLAVVVSVLVACSAQAQGWRTLDAGTSQPYQIDMRTFSQRGKLLMADLRTSNGADGYDVTPHEVRCSDLGVRLGVSRSYYEGTKAPVIDRRPAPAPYLPEEGWVLYGEGSEGRLLAQAVCRIAKSARVT